MKIDILQFDTGIKELAKTKNFSSLIKIVFVLTCNSMGESDNNHKQLYSKIKIIPINWQFSFLLVSNPQFKLRKINLNLNLNLILSLNTDNSIQS